MNIANFELPSPVVLAPMAGITDRPFRQLCCRMGAGLAVSEMVSSNPKLKNTTKSRLRMLHNSDAGIKSVQIAGSVPEELAQAASVNVDNGAEIIDINMGCPAKKVNKKLAGSALLKEPDLVKAILKAVVNAVKVPVTLKIRTGWCENNRNGVDIALLAQDCGIKALAVHGRTRACLFKGEAEYDTIKAIKQAVSIPVIANGDITSPEKASQVLDYTQADAVMIGRAAQGQPWIFRQIKHYLATGKQLPQPEMDEVESIVMEHVRELHHFYGDFMGVRIARKHVSWYVQKHEQGREFRSRFNELETVENQLESLTDYFKNLTK